MSAYLKQKGCGRQLSISLQAFHSRFWNWKVTPGRRVSPQGKETA